MCEFTINGLKYEIINDDKEVRLKGTEGLKRPVRNIPAEVEYDGKKYKVTTLYGGRCPSLGAFQFDDVLTNISLPETITKIETGPDNSAFMGCKKLKDINFPNSLVSIGALSFLGCSAIETLYFGAGLKIIEEYAFVRCTALKEIGFNDKLEKIEQSAFSFCSSLGNVSFPETLKYIGKEAFKGCVAMTEVNIPASVETIEGEAFWDTGVKVVNIYSENINIAADAFPTDAQINYLDANSFPKRNSKRLDSKTVETPEVTLVAEESKKEEPKPADAPKQKSGGFFSRLFGMFRSSDDSEDNAPAPTPTAAAPSPAKDEATSGDIYRLNLTADTTVEALGKEFNDAFGAQLRLYNGNKKAEPAETLGSLGLTADGAFECRSSLTVGSFIERMMQNHGLKVKVYTCDWWVAVLDGLTLKAAGMVKKNAVKADMESMIAYQRSDGEPAPAAPAPAMPAQVKKSATHKDYTIVVMKDNKVVVGKGDDFFDNTKAALREIAGEVGFQFDTNWTTQQLGSKLVDFLNSK